MHERPRGAVKRPGDAFMTGFVSRPRDAFLTDFLQKEREVSAALENSGTGRKFLLPPRRWPGYQYVSEMTQSFLHKSPASVASRSSRRRGSRRL